MFKKIVLIILFVISLFFIGCIPETTDESYLESKIYEVLDFIPPSVESDITFTNELDGCTFKWSTSNESIISAEGKVIQQETHEAVTITVIGSYNEVSLTKNKNVIVLMKENGDVNNPKNDTIKDVIDGEEKEYTVEGIVIGVNAQSFLIKDDTGCILVYKGKDWNCDLTLGDKIKVSGVTSIYGKAKQFGKDTSYEKIGNDEYITSTPVIIEGTKLDEYKIMTDITPVYAKVKGTLISSGSYYNLVFKDADIMGNITYPLKPDELDANINKEIEVYGYITGTSGNDSYLNILMLDFEVIEEEVDPTITKIANVINSELGQYKIKGTVIAVNKQSFLVKDSSGEILVYRGSDWVQDIYSGDVVIVEGNSVEYYNSIQFTTDSTYEKVDNTSVDHGIINKLSYYQIEEYAYQNPMPIVFCEITGTLTKSGSYYNIDLGGSIIGSIAYPFEGYELDALSGKQITVQGYLTSLRGSYLSIMMTSFEEKNIESTDTFDLHILEINDIHGYIEQDSSNANGLSNMAYMINNIRNKNELDDVLLIGAGDMFQGTAISNITHGLTMINAMNAMEFDCMIIGNHEFDWNLNVILNYFDNKEENGEANFPLLNANIYNKSDNTLVTIDGGKVFESIIVEKEGVNVGIIGYIGDVYSSINYVMAKDYYFDIDIASSVEKIGKSLKNQGVDIIVLAVHGGNSSSIENYDINQSVANLKYNNDYLVDAIINAHTHTRQTGYISRYDGPSLPLVQGGGNGQLFGEIVLSLDKDTNEIVNVLSKVNYVSSAGNNYDEETESVIDEAIKENYDILNEVYSVAGETVESKSQLQRWVGNVLIKGTGADISICNTGGLRSTGDIIKGNNITISNMYMINPFDNYLMIVEVTGKDIARFLQNNAVFYGSNVSINSISNSTQKYKVAVVDYVYYWDSFPQNDSCFNSNIIMRDLLIEDIKLNDTFKPISNPEAKVGNLLEKNLSLYKEILPLNVDKFKDEESLI